MRVGVLSVVTLLLVLFAGSAHAQCTKDTDCKGDRVCDAGKCVTGLPPAPPAPPGSEVAPAAAPAPAPPPPVVIVQQQAPAPAPVEGKPKTKRHSPGMMVAGIVMVSVAPLLLLAAVASSVCEPEFYDSDPYDCNNDAEIAGYTIAGVGLLGAGIPLIVVGAKREPATTATAKIQPWFGPNGAGAKLELKL